MQTPKAAHLLLAGLALVAPAAAKAEMILSQVIVDLEAHEAPRDDIEVYNAGSERMYVLAEPFEVLNPGTAEETRIRVQDPGLGGMLVSPLRMVLAPGERRVIRVALTAGRPAIERVYRVAIKPVAGELMADVHAVKVLIGYDVLVLARPAEATGELSGERVGRTLRMRNGSNTSREIFDGRQCDPQGSHCGQLPAKRLYAGASWEQVLPHDAPATYSAAQGSKVVNLAF